MVLTTIPTTLHGNTPSSRHPPPLNDQLSIPGKDGSQLSKRRPYSGVQGRHQRHATLAPATSATAIREPFSPHRNSHPKGGADLRPPTSHPGGCRNPYLKRFYSHRISSSQRALRGVFRHVRTPSRRPPIPATNPTYRPTPSTPDSASSRVRRCIASPNPVQLASGTAAQYSNATDQHRPTTPATNRRPAKITTMDPPARSSDEEAVGSNPATPTR
jgi:hypothetical protein